MIVQKWQSATPLLEKPFPYSAIVGVLEGGKLEFSWHGESNLCAFTPEFFISLGIVAPNGIAPRQIKLAGWTLDFVRTDREYLVFVYERVS